MSFPYNIEATFDDGTRDSFDSETDVGSILDYPHYKELSRYGLAPWRGAHAMRVTIDGSNTAYVQAAAFAQATQSVWLPICVHDDFTLNDGNNLQIFALFSAGTTREATISIRRSGSDYQFVANDPSQGVEAVTTFSRDKTRYYQLEMTVNRTNGTIDFYLDGGQVQSQLTGIAMGVPIFARMGVLNVAASQSGILLFGGVISDDTRIFPRRRFPCDTAWVTHDMQAFIGTGAIDSAQLTGTNTDAVLNVLDTNIYETAITDFSREPIVYTRNTVANAQVPNYHAPIIFNRGLYVQLTGTAPQAWLSLQPNGTQVIMSHGNYVDAGRKG